MGVIDPHLAGDDFLVDWPVYFVSCPLLNSSRKSEFGESGHWRISTGNVSKIAADRPLSKMRQCAIDPNPGGFVVEWPVYFISRRSLNSSRKEEFGVSDHCRIFASNVEKL